MCFKSSKLGPNEEDLRAAGRTMYNYNKRRAVIITNKSRFYII